ncbi:MAG: bifunctional folylpolyglutamate synthase/dihydrofolate synthase [Deferrisomatales bacterium]|nr:bifunctional folylpolyglutamate synthase/dihydrofolate synthase [Deferrisomatales bacterium]
MPSPPLSPVQALAEIDALEKFGIDLGLERVEVCLAALGHPHRQVPCVHVGGTNGKGSTAMLLSAALTACGLRTGLFTSPPLEFFGERIRVDGELLPDAAVPDLYRAVRDAAPPGMTQFEIITAMALLHFARVRVDLAVVEVGLGGRLDSTNVVEPDVTVITNVGLEHCEHLGATIAEIAAEKGGIVKPGIPLVTAAQGEALSNLERLAAGRGSPVYRLGREFRSEPAGPGALDYHGLHVRWDHVAYRLRGAHQADNLAVALAALEVLAARGWNLPEAGIRQGVATATWPGRLEECGSHPTVLLDGAHNPHASRVLATALRDEFRYRRLWLVLGILGDKDARSILADLAPLANRLVLTASASRRALAPADLAAAARQYAGTDAITAPNVGAALDLALSEAGPDDLVCVTGSLTTVGEARGHLRRLGRVP